MKAEAAINAMLEAADLILVDGKAYLLVPLTPSQIDALAAYGAAAEDMELNGDDEPIGAAQIEDMDRVTAANKERKILKYGSVP